MHPSPRRLAKEAPRPETPDEIVGVPTAEKALQSDAHVGAGRPLQYLHKISGTEKVDSNKSRVKASPLSLQKPSREN